jgi:hypothetical protein
MPKQPRKKKDLVKMDPALLNPPEKSTPGLEPDPTWEEKRKRKVSEYFEKHRLDPIVAKDAFEAPKWMKRKYPGMEFALLPAEPLRLQEKLTEAHAWELVPTIPGPIPSPDGYVHQGDCVWAMRPQEIGNLARKKEEIRRDAIYAPASPHGEASEMLAGTVDDLNRRFGRELFGIGDDSRLRVERTMGRIEDTPDFEPGEVPLHEREERTVKNYVHGFGPSKLFGGNQKSED